ncbi:Angiopoietin-related protein 7 [Mizuhopecten yessoensis]|uniref:Angiopoietin-related protein 7 n=1 Tax=Mizuhopecten yessoensis TaxID=6573 RepID=A0A210PI16_MIZYE|nr:Angiopoietin-related protein 7 [Mizuhopecten yessoensis]
MSIVWIFYFKTDQKKREWQSVLIKFSLNNIFYFLLKGLADCNDVGLSYCSGVFTVTPVTGTTFDVYCDMDTPGGPWTVIQNRYDGSVDFMRSWAEYKDGFGHINGEFWLGMEPIRSLLVLGQALRITLESWQGDVKYADFTTFHIGSETEKYMLTLQYSGGTLTDEISYHSGKVFSTFDRDNDNAPFSCSDLYKGAWWYGWCYSCNLFGLYVEDIGNDDTTSMTWRKFYSDREKPPLRKCKMMVKRLT